MQVFLRRLPSGTAQNGELLQMAGAGLDVQLEAESDEFIAGALVEAQSGPMLYLGQIQAVSGRTVKVFIEHSLNLDEVAAFRKRWQ